MGIYEIVFAIVGLAVGFIIAKLIERNTATSKIKEAKNTASSIVKDAKAEAENLKKDKILQAKEKFLELKAEHEKVILNRDKKISEAEKRVRDKESQVSNELAKNKKLTAVLESKKGEYEERLAILDKKQQEVDRLHRSQIEQLE